MPVDRCNQCYESSIAISDISIDSRKLYIEYCTCNTAQMHLIVAVFGVDVAVVKRHLQQNSILP